MYWMGVFPGAHWSFHYGPQQDAAWRSYIVDFEANLGRAHGPVVTLTLTNQVEAPNAAQRKQLAELLGGEVFRKVTHHGLVTQSRPVQLTLTALGWIITRHYEERVFVDARPALGWIASCLPATDPETIRKEIAAVVPERYLLPELRHRPITELRGAQ